MHKWNSKISLRLARDFKKKCLILFFLFGIICPIREGIGGFDYRYDSPEGVQGQYEAGAAGKMTRGLTNAAFGWTEVASTPARMAAGIEYGAVTSFLVGLPYGVLRAAGRTMVGVYEVGTFFAPQSPIMRDLQGDVS